MKNQYIIETIESMHDFKNLKKTWEELNIVNSNSSLFTSFTIFEYYYQIIQNMSSQTRIKIFIIKNKRNEIKAIFPFTYEKQIIAGKLNLYRLSIKDDIIGWSPLLIDPHENIHQIITEFMLYLKKNKNTWDVITFHHIPKHDISYTYLHEISKNNFNITTNETKTLVIDCTIDFDALIQHMKGKKRREMKRKIKRLTENGSIELISMRNY